MKNRVNRHRDSDRARLLLSAAAAVILNACGSSHAQSLSPKADPKCDFAVTFSADRTNPVNGSNQWLFGGSAELGASVGKGFGAAAKVTGVTTSELGSQGIPANLVITVFGPRYRLQRKGPGHKLSVYGEGLLGIANGFRSLYPTPTGITDSANALALQVGGGADLVLARHLAVRAVEASWLRTQFPNGTTNVQNHLMLGSGLSLRF